MKFRLTLQITAQHSPRGPTWTIWEEEEEEHLLDEIGISSSLHDGILRNLEDNSKRMKDGVEG